MDAYCASHVGNDVLLESSLAVVRRAFPNADIRVHAKTPDAFRDSLGMDCGQRLFKNAPRDTLGKLIWLSREPAFMTTQLINQLTLRTSPHRLALGFRAESLRDFEWADVAISIGGEMINDSFRKTLPMYMFMFWIAERCGADVLVFPQSIGPLRRRWTRRLTAHVLETCRLVSPRDEPSREELHSLGLKGNHALFSPDVGVAQPTSSSEEAQRFLLELGISPAELKRRTWIGLTTSPWVEEGVDSKDYLQTIVQAISTLSDELEIGVLVLPANMPVNGNDVADYQASARVKKAIDALCPVHMPQPQVVPARLFKAVTRELDLFISTRMHASILATMAGTPTLTINTQRKLRGFMALIDQEQYALDISGLDDETICNAARELLRSSGEVSASLKQHASRLTEQVQEYAETVRHVVGQRVPPP